MKTKKTFIPIVTLCAALFLTACTGKDAATTEKPQDSQTEASTEATGDSSTTLDDLYQQENQIFADHEDVWNKAFGMMNKSTADPSGNYADFLASTVESNKDAFTEDELNTLTTDIETIRKIEEQIAEIEKKDTTSESADANDNSGSTSPFQNFSGQDYDGNTVDESLFSGNAVTVINFWFTGCKPCVAELSKLNELNDAIKSMGCEVIGIKDYEKKYGNKEKEVDYFDGISFAPTLLGKNKQKKHDFLYWEFDETDQIAVRMDDWKMVVKKGTPFLYNLKTDIHEDHDITLQHPDIVEKMKAIIFEQHTPNPHFSVTLPKR